MNHDITEYTKSHTSCHQQDKGYVCDLILKMLPITHSIKSMDGVVMLNF